MLSALLWYLVISITGLAALPLAYRYLPGLPDRGYSLSRSLGWMLWGFLFWLLASLGVVRNDVGGLLFAFALLVGLSTLALQGGRLGELRDWLRGQRGLVLTIEILFLAAFAGYAVIRAANPEAVGTEKPMELAFINAILHSPAFPPHDPWLSGYAISYYYFGYVLVAMLAKLAGTMGSVAFNLGIVLVFALSAIGAYGLVYNLLAAHFKGRPAAMRLPALLGPFFLLIVSNLEGFLHSLHNRGLFWSGGSSAFWSWLDINDLKIPPDGPLSWVPSQFWWWWRASRVVQDYDFTRAPKEIIDEFPFFSYLLADLHPHVLAMPFGLLAMALALNLFLGGGRGRLEWLHHRFNLRTLVWAALLAFLGGLALMWSGYGALSLRQIMIGLAGAAVGGVGLIHFSPAIQQHGAAVLTRREINETEMGISLDINTPTFLLAAVILGGMAFLNIWDFPVYVALFAGAYVLKRAMENGWRWNLVKEFLFLGAALGIAGIILYLPFYLGFKSQAGGPLPNLIFPTRGAHLWVMFGTLLLPLSAFLVYSQRQAGGWKKLKIGFGIAAAIALVLWVASLLFGWAITLLPAIGSFYLGNLGAPAFGPLLKESLLRRLINTGGWVTLVGLLGVVIALLARGSGERDARDSGEGIREAEQDTGDQSTPRPSEYATLFALLLALLATLVVLGPEFFYLRDQFGTRMNTIFKFYFQAWQFWSIAAAFGSVVLLRRLRGLAGIAFSLGLLLVVAAGLVYPVFGIWSKTNGFKPGLWTLDSTQYLENQDPDEAAAIRWLRQARAGVVAEAVPPAGGSYTTFARVSMLSGQPAVLGWIGHESQWRGGGAEMGSRQGDLERLYCTRDWGQAQEVLRQYNIRYVFIGQLERMNYQPNGSTCPVGLNEAKFERALTRVFEQGAVKIYEVPGLDQ